MGYSTFAQAKAFVAPGYGECDDAKLGAAVNMIRQHFFNWYQELSLFLDGVECFRVHSFPLTCNDCSNFYQGVTLPRRYQTVEAMWWNDWPVALQSSWREFQTGISPECDCRLQKIDMPGTVPTALDIDPRRPSKVRVRCLDPEDKGKRFVVTGTAATRQPFKQEFALSTDLQETAQQLLSIQPMGGIIKAQTVGRVMLLHEDGTPLGFYEPAETVPAYRRLKLLGLRDGCETVNIRANMRYVPLFDDDDVVESDNQVAFDAMARYLRLYEKSDKTSQDTRSAELHYSTAVKMMMGEKARDSGKGTQAELVIKTPDMGGYPGLNRFRGGRL